MYYEISVKDSPQIIWQYYSLIIIKNLLKITFNKGLIKCAGQTYYIKTKQSSFFNNLNKLLLKGKEVG